MGYGDFKAVLRVRCVVSAGKCCLPIILFASLVGSVIGIWLIFRQRKGIDTQIPFGPYLAAGGWLALLFGQVVISRLFVPHTG